MKSKLSKGRDKRMEEKGRTRSAWRGTEPAQLWKQAFRFLNTAKTKEQEELWSYKATLTPLIQKIEDDLHLKISRRKYEGEFLYKITGTKRKQDNIPSY